MLIIHPTFRFTRHLNYEGILRYISPVLLITKQLSVLEPQFLRVPQLVKGGIAAKLHHGRRTAHQYDVVLARRKQVLRNHGRVHATRAIWPILLGLAQNVPKLYFISYISPVVDWYDNKTVLST